MNIPLTLTYDDVLIVPLRSRVSSRKDVDTSSLITPKIRLAVPVVSANMDTVTESNMAIAMAQAGGVGVIHRFFPIEKQVEEVMLVKRNQNIVIDEPHTVAPEDTIQAVIEKSQRLRCKSFLVAGLDNKLLGILTRRDMQFVRDKSVSVASAMTPYKKLIVANLGIDIPTAQQVLYEHRIEKLPLVDGENRIRGLITATDIFKSMENKEATKDSRGRLCVGAAIGVKGDYMQRAEALIRAGVDFLVLDIAHGHSESEIAVLRELKMSFPSVEIMAGNVATQQGAMDLIDAGADAIKVGIGGGSACITRVTAGVGIPQFSAVVSVAEICKQRGVPMCADGGIRGSADLTKALAAGAQNVMVGSLLAGTDETPGVVMTYQNQRFKIYRGMASLTANMIRPDKKTDEGIETITPEGIEARVPYKGPVKNILHQLRGGLRSGMSYSDALTLPEFAQKAMFVRITQAGLSESYNHTNQRV